MLIACCFLKHVNLRVIRECSGILCNATSRKIHLIYFTVQSSVNSIRRNKQECYTRANNFFAKHKIQRYQIAAREKLKVSVKTKPVSEDEWTRFRKWMFCLKHGFLNNTEMHEFARIVAVTNVFLLLRLAMVSGQRSETIIRQRYHSCLARW